MAWEASLQTSIFQARNRTTGTTVSLTRKSDVKNHLSLRFRAKTNLRALESLPDATDNLVPEPGAIGIIESPFAKDFSAEHTIAGISSTPTAGSAGSPDSLAPKTSKSAQP